MTRLKLRTFMITMVLVSSTMALSLEFSNELISGTDQTFDKDDEIRQLSDDFGNRTSSVTNENFEDTQDPTIDTDLFYIREIWNIITAVPRAASDIFTLATSAFALTGLNPPNGLFQLISIVTIGVIFAVVAASRGWDV